MGITFVTPQFNLNVPGAFDLIGLIQPRYDDDGNRIYPPMIHFEGDGFVCKWTGQRPMAGNVCGPLNFKKILNLEKEEKNNVNTNN